MDMAAEHPYLPAIPPSAALPPPQAQPLHASPNYKPSVPVITLHLNSSADVLCLARVQPIHHQDQMQSHTLIVAPANKAQKLSHTRLA
jgi:hypothetical protein